MAVAKVSPIGVFPFAVLELAMKRDGLALGDVLDGELGVFHAERIEDSGLQKFGVWHAGILFHDIGGDVKALAPVLPFRSGFPPQGIPG